MGWPGDQIAGELILKKVLKRLKIFGTHKYMNRLKGITHFDGSSCQTRCLRRMHLKIPEIIFGFFKLVSMHP